MRKKHGRAEIMRPEELFQRFTKLNTATLSDGIKAPHKYLLLLFAIGQCLKGKDRMIPYEHVKKALEPLLKRYAPYAKTLKPELPFWHLQNDGIWELESTESENLPNSGVLGKKTLAEMHGGLTQEDYELFSNNPDIAMSVAQEILDLRYPSSLHEQILETAGIDIESDIGVADDNEPNTSKKFQWFRRHWRDPKFPKEVIKAYENQCAVCRFSIRMDEKPIGLEAAHIKWHQYDGPAKVSNGLALCAIHHELFDAGAFTISPDVYKVKVSDLFSGQGDDEMLGRYDADTLRVLPNVKNDHPNRQYLVWHIKNIYRGDPSSLL